MDCTDDSQGFPVDDNLKAAVSSYLSKTSAEPNIGSKQPRRKPPTTSTLYDDFAIYSFEHVSREVKANANNVLPYIVSDYSSYSGMYYPHNIMENKPSDQSSRWASASNDQSQYLMLKFEHPVVACSITFGKFHRGHVCNVKEFKIYGGMNPDSDMVELLHSGLRNDTVPEMFPLLHITQKSMVFPIQYLKIVPLSTYGVTFNYCIWFVQVRGNNDVKTISKVLKLYRGYKETETARYCLKYFRQRNMMDMYYMLKNRLGITLEDSLVSELHQQLVIEGNYEAAEEIIDRAHALNVFEPFAQKTRYTLEWKQLWTENENYRPCARGGHQMCLDVQRQRIYLFGGWNGIQDLADFWYYSIQHNTWHLISPNTEMNRGPRARSCHKICLDAQGKSLLVFGRYIDQFSPKIKSALPDLYRYWIDEDHWERVSESTLNDGGPDILYDSQICVDPVTSEIYVFGGQDVCARPMDGRQVYGDLYSLHIDDNVWECIRRDGTERSNDIGLKGLKSRVGHSMLFDTTTRDLYILAGKRHKDQLTDLIRFSVDQDQLALLSDNISKDGGPSGTFTQRAAIDCQKQEIYVHTATMQKNVANAPVANDFFVYSIRNNQWIKVEGDNGPLPRYAHELVYNPTDGTFYLFGGNPGNTKADARRLDDFWQLRLRKPDSASILRRCIYMLRMQKLRELCRRQTSPFAATTETMQALEYLRTKVAPLVDEDNESEKQEFQMICSRMFISSEITEEEVNPFEAHPGDQGTPEVFAERTRLFEDIIAYLPPEMREPSGQLTDVVRI